MIVNRTARKTSVALGVLVLVLVLVAARYGNPIRTLMSLRQVNEYPVYFMNYYGDYYFSDFLTKGATSDSDLEKYVFRRLTWGSRSPGEDMPPFGCTAFCARTPDNEVLYGRNFDHPYTPILILYTKPDRGYASLSTVDLAYGGFSSDNLPTESIQDRIRLLGMPYLPFDGMNEAGVAISLLAVPSAEPGSDPQKPTLNTTGVIRLVLDYAATVNEAVDLIRQYNVYFSADIACHYLISDSSGDSAVVEFEDGDIAVVRSETPWQVVTNYILSDPSHPGDGQDRFAIVDRHLQEAGSLLGANDAMSLLEAAAMPEYTQWSVVYNLSSRSAALAGGQRFDTLIEYTLRQTP